ncbi:serine/threonine-protein kinase [Cellulomonas gilvus]|uniref:Serine/threonine protein kinase n=1 Tax=Cellulomonas gilvus (strain ATCC 13127 / NRRL B-14078) TaxID=593907 RepID=F8A5B5_CELGA|nr:serine/threonine-protein kinase [Cellulomonas gilvus]AEI10932.1 serine/threonine protein kinase [Cellulomonas gilvus ATCC 13127]
MERIGLAPGAQIGGYTIVAPLGSGGMGTVYRAVDDGGTAVALKLLHPQIGADAVGRDRLRREVVALQRLRHPAVASVLDAEADSTEAFIVTELVPGENLADHVRAHGPLGHRELHDLAAGLYDALAAVHGAGVVHRDLKPSNVLVTDDGPVLIDFGIAQAAGEDSAQVTSTGLVVGTPGYLAPELLDGADPTPATDLWGWAAVVAFAATGRPPFGSRPLEAVLGRARSGDVDLDGLGPVTAGALRRALAPVPAERLDAEDVVAALGVVAVDGDPADAATEQLVGVPATVAYPADDDEVALAATTLVGPATAGGPTHDGATRVMSGEPTSLLKGPPDDEGDDPEDDLDDDLEDGPAEGVDWIEDDLDASEELPPEGSGYLRPPARRRWGSLLALLALVAAAAALAPALTLLVVVLLVVAVRTAGVALESMYARRERRGPGGADVARTVAASPWYLVRALVGLVPSLVVSACAMVLVGGVVAWLVDNGTWTIGDLTSGDDVTGTAAATVVAGVVVLGVLVLWFGPLSLMTRTGARRVLAAAAPPGLGALVLVCVGVAAAAVLVSLVAHGAGIVWAPAPVPTIP